MSKEESRQRREIILASIKDWERLREIATEALRIDAKLMRPGRPSRDDYRRAIEEAFGNNFARVLEVLESDEIEEAHRAVCHKNLRGRQNCIDALLPLVCGTITCFVTGQPRADTSEEQVRQRFARALCELRGWTRESMVLELPVKAFSAKRGKLDIAVFRPEERNRDQENVYMIVECKAHGISAAKYEDAIKQLKSYLGVCPNVRYGIVTTTDKTTIFRKLRGAVGNKRGNYELHEEHDVPSARQEAAPMTIVGPIRQQAEPYWPVAVPPVPQRVAPQARASGPEHRLTAAWENLCREPERYLVAHVLGYDDKWLAQTRRVSEIVISNGSQFPVQDVRGDVTWMEGAHASIGVLGFTTRGVIQPGQRAAFSLSEGTLNSTPIATRGHAVLRCLGFNSVTVVR